MRKVIEFDETTYHALIQLGRDRMATLQELADESFIDLLKKHGVPKDLKDALRKSAKAIGGTKKSIKQTKSRTSPKKKSLRRR
jgi:hypothetical protein